MEKTTDSRQCGPLAAGWAAAKANRLPMVVLWGLSLALVGAYYLSATFAGWLEPVLRWQKESGYLAAALNRAFFYGAVPGVFQILMPRLRPRRLALTILAQGLWCALFGVATDAFYRGLAEAFGSGHDLMTLALKTGVNQFVWTVLVVAPANALFFFWVARDFSLGRARAEWPVDYVRRVYLPNLVSNWCVWIPVNLAVFAFPLPLQVQLSGFVGAFWTLMCLKLGEAKGEDEQT